MPIIGAVLTLSEEPEVQRATLDFLQEHQAIELGEPQILGWPVVIESSSRAEERALWDKLEALPGVVSASVVFTDFSDLVERKDIQE